MSAANNIAWIESQLREFVHSRQGKIVEESEWEYRLASDGALLFALVSMVDMKSSRPEDTAMMTKALGADKVVISNNFISVFWD